MREITVDQEGNRSILRAPVYLDGRDLPSFDIRYVFHELPADEVSARGDALLAGLLLPAMTMGEDLAIEAPVSPLLMENLDAIVALQVRWWPNASPVKVLAPVEAQPGGDRIGVFFSGGGDSWYSLLHNMDRHPDGDDAVTDLVFSAGIDSRYGFDERFVRDVAGMVKDVAGAMGKRALILESNLRTEMKMLWPRHIGAGLASLGLALSPTFSRFLIASERPHGYLVPAGTHPVLDPMWSTEAVEFRHDGWDVDRMQKMRRVIESEVAMNNLRVCHERDQQPLNCGECAKCIRSKLVLYSLGALDRCDTFLTPLDPRSVTGVKVAGMHIISREILGLLGDSKFDRRIARRLKWVSWQDEVHDIPRKVFPSYMKTGRLLRRALRR